jgi:rhodanese-related sulfurtransferase
VTAARRTIAEVLAAARGRIVRHEPAAAAAAQARGAILVDTRSADDLRAFGTPPGALHLPLSVLPWRADPECPWHDPVLAADLGREVILLCAHGFSSSLAAALLAELGFTRAGDVAGGFEAWAAAGLPVEPPMLSP